MQATDLLTLSKMLARHHNWSLSTVALYAANDGKFLRRIEAGGGCTLRTASRVMAWLSTNWPTDLAWPVDIQRPSKVKVAA